MRWEEKLLGRIEKTSSDNIDIKEFQIGKIITIDPLVINLDGLPLYNENLYINSNLLEHTREFTTLTGTVGDSTMIISNGSINFKAQLVENSYVLLREMTQNKFALVCILEGV